jgi:hypothetical protein
MVLFPFVLLDIDRHKLPQTRPGRVLKTSQLVKENVLETGAPLKDMSMKGTIL